MADEFLIRFLDESSVAQDLAIVDDPEGDHHLAVVTRHVLSPVYSSVASVSSGTTENIYSQTTAAITRIRKIVATGNTDGFFKLLVGGSVVAMGKIGPVIRVWKENFDGGVLYVPISTNITLQVQNINDDVTGSYEAIIYTGD